jgi:hypothetical protein
MLFYQVFYGDAVIIGVKSTIQLWSLSGLVLAVATGYSNRLWAHGLREYSGIVGALVFSGTSGENSESRILYRY